MKLLQVIVLGVWIASFATTLNAQTEQAPVNSLYTFRFTDSPLDAVLNSVKNLTQKDITVDLDVLGIQAKFTLESTEKITREEAIDRITQALNAQYIRLEQLDDRTIRVRSIPHPISGVKYTGDGDAARNRIAELRAQRNGVQPSVADTPTGDPDGISAP